MPEKRRCLGCGDEYWFPGQRWQHDRCSVGVAVKDVGVDAVLVEAVVNASNAVVNRTKDRHKKTPERQAYMREYMRKRRSAAKA